MRWKRIRDAGTGDGAVGTAEWPSSPVGKTASFEAGTSRAVMLKMSGSLEADSTLGDERRRVAFHQRVAG